MKNYKGSVTAKKFVTNGTPAAIFYLLSVFIVRKIGVSIETNPELYYTIQTVVIGMLQGVYSAVINFWKKYVWPIIRTKLENVAK